ncbi:hypothetical protein TWF281_003942 [Arthrobotrys megalospora]
MSDTAVSSTPTAETTLPGQSESSTIGPTETPSPTDQTTATTPEETTPPPETTTAPEETTTSTPDPTTESTPDPTSTTDEPSSTTEEPSSTSELSTSTEESTTEPASSTTSNVTVITVTPTTGGDTTITITTTSVNTEQTTTSLPASSTQTSSSTSSSTNSATAIPSTGGGGLSQPAKIAIAIIIPIFAVILIAFLGIFFWRRYKKRKDSEEMRRKEVEEYGYNPNNDVSGSGPAVMTAAGGANQGGDMSEVEAGYRGWGNTAGGRKASAPLSASATTNTAGAGYGNTPYSNAAANAGQQYPSPQQPELYGSPVAAGAVPVAAGAAGAAVVGAAHLEEEKQNRDRHSHSPLLSSPTNRPSTADSSTIGAPATTGPSELDDGLHRGDSVASSRYTNATRQSEDSGAHEVPGNNGYRNTYVSDGNDYYNDVANPYAGDYDNHEHAPEQGYHQPPMIQQVGARRNTRIETPPDTHYAQMPRQGTSGIAQNF